MPNSAQVGAICEALVLADLLRRGLEVTKPVIDVGDDLHARFDRGWLSVQIKARDRSSKRWRASDGRRRGRIKSELLALVDYVTHEIRYQMVGAYRTLPEELRR